MASAAPEFRDHTRLTRWTTGLLHAHAVICVVWIVSDWMQLQLLASAPYSPADAEANDSRQSIVGGLYAASFAATVLAVAMWVYRANINARALGARDMQFTPGWAVGWYFVPIATFWMPYRAMVEIWRASRNPTGWQAETGIPLLPQWWLSWIATCIIGHISVRMSLSAQTVDQIASATWVNIISSAVTIPSAVLLARLVQEIWLMQMRWHLGVPATVLEPVGELPSGTP